MAYHGQEASPRPGPRQVQTSRLKIHRLGSAAFVLAFAIAAVARAQDAPVAPPPAPTSASPPASQEAAPSQKPPPYAFEPAPPSVHAPQTAFWVGARLGLLGYGGAFFVNAQNREETTGNFIGQGLAGEANVGDRLNHRYIPYLLLEYAVLQPGHRFNDNTSAQSILAGLGFRFIIGNVHRTGFLADLSVGRRTISVAREGHSFKMQAPEIFRLGLGAEIRMSTRFTLSPLAHLSGGSMSQSSGEIFYAPQGDGADRPTFIDGSISGSQRSYLVVGIGCGAHFDLFGD